MADHLEQALADALDDSARKSELLAHTSHEIRTELSGILGMAQVVMETRLTPEQSEYLTIINDSGEAILTLVNDLLDFSKMEAGRLEVERVSFSLADTLSDTVANFSGSTASRGLYLNLEIDSSVPARLLGDPGRIRQVVGNLVSNAVKFTDLGGITVRARLDDLLVIDVVDTGSGIDPSRQAAIFESYTQGDDSTSRTHGGTGLGLSIARQLTEMMGGGLALTSERGKGSTFTASFAIDHDVDSIGEDPRASRGFEGLPVLLAGELVTEEALEGNGFVLSRCERAEVVERVAAATRAGSPFGLVVLGFTVDPLAVAQAIHESDASQSTHVMVITSIGNRGDATLCRDLQVAGYLTNPFVDDDISAAAVEVLNGPAPVDLTTLVTKHWLRERRRRLNVLIVDASPTIRMTTGRMLERRGHLSVAVASAADASVAVAANRFDAVVVDLGLAKVHDLLSELEGGDAPVIGSTSDESIDTDDMCVSVLPRPFGVHELVAAIEESVT